MSTYAIQNIFTDGSAKDYMVDALEAVNYQARENFNYIFERIMKGLDITPDTVLYAKEESRDGDVVSLALFTDEECTKYTELDVDIEEPNNIEGVQAVTLGVNEAPYVIIK